MQTEPCVSTSTSTFLVRSTSPEAAEVRCVFCSAASFRGQEELEEHYLHDCPSLTTCPKCEQIVERALLEEHACG
jgi:hypothetical protein